MKMSSRTRYAVVVGILGLMVVVGLIVLLPGKDAHLRISEAEARASKALTGYDLSGVAWSPNGKHIAFVAMPKVPAKVKEEMGGPKRADIWLMDLPAKASRLRRIVKLEEEHGIPVALFWISDHQIGWAAASTEAASGFTFFKAQVETGEISRLTECRFDLAQTRAGGEGIEAPDDVWWDPKAHTIIFTGEALASPETPNRILGWYDVEGSTLSMVIPDYGFMDRSLLTFCFAPGGMHSGLYVAGPRGPVRSIQWQVWFTSNMLSLYEEKKIVKRKIGALLFPRLSPNGKMLAVLLLEAVPYPTKDQILVHDLATDSEKIVASLSPEWNPMRPGMGCPFSWSPDGKEIAYADGSMIKIVEAPASIEP